MKIRFSQDERIFLHRMFDMLAFAARRDKKEHKTFQKMANIFFAPAPATHLKIEQVKLIFGVMGHARNVAVEKKVTTNTEVMDSVLDKLMPYLIREYQVDEQTGIRGADAI